MRIGYNDPLSIVTQMSRGGGGWLTEEDSQFLAISGFLYLPYQCHLNISGAIKTKLKKKKKKKKTPILVQNTDIITKPTQNSFVFLLVFARLKPIFSVGTILSYVLLLVNPRCELNRSGVKGHLEVINLLVSDSKTGETWMQTTLFTVDLNAVPYILKDPHYFSFLIMWLKKYLHLYHNPGGGGHSNIML